MSIMFTGHLLPRRGPRPGAGFSSLLPSFPERGQGWVPTCALLFSLGFAAPVQAQCQPTWTVFPLEALPQRNNGVFNLAVHDEDGSGPLPTALYLMDTCMFFGDLPYRTARFDGWAWSTVPNLNGGHIPGAHVPNERVIRDSLSVPDTAPSVLQGLWGAGAFDYTDHRRLPSGLARFDGRSWNGASLGSNTHALALFDEDGDGPLPAAIFAGSGFASNGLMRWDGRQASPVGGAGFSGILLELCVFDDDGVGPLRPALIVAGGFSRIGGITAHNVARWDGTTWSNVGAVGSGTDAGPIYAFSIFDEDGPGPSRPALFMGGAFSRLGGPAPVTTDAGVARWDGERWSAIPGLTGGTVLSLATFDDDGPGPNRESLFISGLVRIDGVPANGIARWDGQVLYPLERGLSGLFGAAETMAVFDEDGPGPNPGGLYIGGPFSRANDLLTIGFARWGCPLTPHCYADCDTSTGRRQLDIFDFLCYQSRYEINDPSACDCDFSTGARVCDVFDFLCFQNAFANGCP